MNSWAQVGIGTTSPAAILDVTSSNSGILIPRVALTSTGSLSPLTSATAKASELVYNTATVNDVTPGYYYLSTATGPWVRLVTAADTATAWRLTGNANTNPTSNYLGTSDNVDLSIKTNAIEKMRITAAGNVGIGITPEYKLDVNGNVSISDKVFSRFSLIGRSAPYLLVDNIKPYTDLGVRIYDGNSNAHLTL